MLMGGQAEGVACTDPGARTPIGVTGINKRRRSIGSDYLHFSSQFFSTSVQMMVQQFNWTKQSECAASLIEMYVCMYIFPFSISYNNYNYKWNSVLYLQWILNENAVVWVIFALIPPLPPDTIGFQEDFFFKSLKLALKFPNSFWWAVGGSGVA
jgi:hypothetical protein